MTFPEPDLWGGGGGLINFQVKERFLYSENFPFQTAERVKSYLRERVFMK